MLVYNLLVMSYKPTKSYHKCIKTHVHCYIIGYICLYHIYLDWLWKFNGETDSMSMRYIGISVKKARVNILVVFVPDFEMCLNWSKTSKAALGVFQDSGHQSKCFRICICLVKSFERMSMMLLLKNAGWRWLDVAGAAEVLI